jgi:hypothetical protein
MAKGWMRGNRQIKKLKQEKVAPKAADLLASQARIAANTNTKRAKGKARWS